MSLKNVCVGVIFGKDGENIIIIEFDMMYKVGLDFIENFIKLFLLIFY